MTTFSLELDDDQLQLQKWVHDFAADVIRPAAREWDEREETPWPIIQEAANIGLYSWEFVANAFAPTDRMPDWLQTVAEWNPISALVQALRDLWGNGEPATAASAWPLHHPVLVTVVWSLALTAIFMPLALRAFAARSRD